MYIIESPAYPGWVKIGITGNLKKRLQVYQTSSPFRDYRLVYSVKHPDYKEAERRIRETMVYFAKGVRGEWYEIDLAIAKSRLDEQLEEYERGGPLGIKEETTKICNFLGTAPQ